MNTLQDLLDAHYNASVYVYNSNIGIQPLDMKSYAREAIRKAESDLAAYMYEQRRLGYQEGKADALDACYEVKEYAKKLGLRLWDGKLA